MKLSRRTPRMITKLIDKKRSRRRRIKGTHVRTSPELNTAELLIASWYGPPARRPFFKGSPANVRQELRLRAHRKQWDNTPTNSRVSRQVKRQGERANA